MGWLKNLFFFFLVFSTFSLDVVNRGNRLGRTVNIKKANEQAKIYVGRSLTRHIVRCMFGSLTMHESEHTKCPNNNNVLTA